MGNYYDPIGPQCKNEPNNATLVQVQQNSQTVRCCRSYTSLRPLVSSFSQQLNPDLPPSTRESLLSQLNRGD
jgi:hypothetical protein